MARVPNQPKTPLRSIRVPDDVWQEAKTAAQRHGETVTDVIIRALRAYIARNGDPDGNVGLDRS